MKCNIAGCENEADELCSVYMRSNAYCARHFKEMCGSCGDTRQKGVICPTCGGQKTKPRGVMGDAHTWAGGTMPYSCPTCDGKGYLTMPKNNLKLYVWTDFCPYWTEGLAFAIAETVEEAKQLVEVEHGLIVGVDDCVQDWGTLTIHDIDKCAWCVEGGGYV